MTHSDEPTMIVAAASRAVEPTAACFGKPVEDSSRDELGIPATSRLRDRPSRAHTLSLCAFDRVHVNGSRLMVRLKLGDSADDFCIAPIGRHARHG
jgi:hypothetical protein